MEISPGKGDRSVMEKGWWGESPSSDRQNRLPEPEQHGGACPGGRYRRGFSFVVRLPRNRPGAGQHPGGSLLPHALHQRIGTGAFVPLTGSMDRKAPLYTGNFTDGFCPVPRPLPAGIFSWGEGQPCPVHRRAFALYPGPCPPGYSHREGASPDRLSCQ